MKELTFSQVPELTLSKVPSECQSVSWKWLFLNFSVRAWACPLAFPFVAVGIQLIFSQVQCFVWSWLIGAARDQAF